MKSECCDECRLKRVLSLDFIYFIFEMWGVKVKTSCTPDKCCPFVLLAQLRECPAFIEEAKPTKELHLHKTASIFSLLGCIYLFTMILRTKPLLWAAGFYSSVA